MRSKRTNEFLEKLNLIAAENFDLEIIPQVSGTVFPDYDCDWVFGEWSYVKIDEYTVIGERIYMRSEHEEEAVEEYMNMLFTQAMPNVLELTEEELEERARQEMEWTKAIFVYITD